MGVGYNPKIVTDGLVLCLDAGNAKSYPGILGAELVTNSIITQIDNTTFNVLRDATQNITLPLCNVEAGKTYYVDYLITSYTGTVGATFRINGGGGNLTPVVGISAAGRFNAKFTASISGSLSINGDNTGTNFNVDYVSVREVLTGTGTTWFDLSGNGNHANIDNYSITPTFSSSFSGAFDFSNNGRFYIDISQLNNTNSYSVIWFGADGAGDQYGGISRDVAWQTGNHLIGWRTGAINSDTGRDTNTNSSGNEFMICHTNNTSTKIVDQYLNGIYYGSFTYTNWIARERWSFGSRGDGEAHQYTGKICIALLYNRILTATEIQQNFNALRGRFGI